MLPLTHAVIFVYNAAHLYSEQCLSLTYLTAYVYHVLLTTSTVRVADHDILATLSVVGLLPTQFTQ